MMLRALGTDPLLDLTAEQRERIADHHARLMSYCATRLAGIADAQHRRLLRKGDDRGAAAAKEIESAARDLWRHVL